MIYPHCMLDLETLGTEPGCVILQIGGVAFDLKGGTGLHHFYTNVSIQSCLNAGLHVKGSTVEFWLTQDEDARKGLLEPKPILLAYALGDFCRWFVDTGCRYVWGHGATFDPPIFAEAWSRALPGGLPWEFRDVRDTRTIYDVAGQLGWEPPRRTELKHIAVEDALYQVRCVQSAFLYLRKGV